MKGQSNGVPKGGYEQNYSPFSLLFNLVGVLFFFFFPEQVKSLLLLANRD